jgi:hypothetical protein
MLMTFVRNFYFVFGATAILNMAAWAEILINANLT